MSPLTKLFVGSLIVLSLLLAAGTVVYVNQDHQNKLAAEMAQQQASAARTQAETAKNEAEAARATAQESVRQVMAQLEEARQRVNAVQAQASDKDAQIAQAKQQEAIQSIQITSLTGALKGAQDRMSLMQDQLGELRGGNDKLVMQNAQLNQTNTDLTSRLDVTERERKLLAEQNMELKNQVERQASTLKDLGVTPAQLASAGTRLGAPPINGVIRNVQVIQGVRYASISVGSADSVVPGMEFKVVNRDNGQFLGVLKVDRVEQNEATGRLEGPRIAEIRPGSEVKTQL